MTQKMISMPVGVVVRRTPGATRWAKYAWRAVAVLPFSGPASWKQMRAEGDAVEYHAGTVEMQLWRSDTEAYRVALANDPPSVYVVMRESESTASPHALDLVGVTASPYEAQDHTDTGEDIVESVPMPEGLVAWIRDFVERHHVEETFIKRKRDKTRIDLLEDGRGDERVVQAGDVYRSPSSKRRRLN
ncbi:MAG: DUF3305 domain-containing protein [Pseudomonadota bacterium]